MSAENPLPEKKFGSREYNGKLPEFEEFKAILRESLRHLEEDCDSCCDFDFELAQWQAWVGQWPQILDENGGL